MKHTAGNNATANWRAENVSVGVGARGEIYTVTVSEQGRPSVSRITVM